MDLKTESCLTPGCVYEHERANVIYPTNNICVQLTFSTLASLQKDGINIVWQKNKSTLDGAEQTISIGNDEHTEL